MIDQNENVYDIGLGEEAEIAQALALMEADRALAAVRSRMATGASYSHCDECGDEIPQARQTAIPGVRHCIFCAERREHLGKLQG